MSSETPTLASSIIGFQLTLALSLAALRKGSIHQAYLEGVASAKSSQFPERLHNQRSRQKGHYASSESARFRPTLSEGAVLGACTNFERTYI